jgi:putative transposase
VYRFIDAERANRSVRELCRTMDVPRSAFQAWKREQQANRDGKDRALRMRIRAAHAASGGTYGSPRITRAIREGAEVVGRRRVARLMREDGITGVPRRKYRATTDSRHTMPVSENLLARDFSADRPNQAWAADITAVRTVSGWLYVAVLLDVFSRKVVGWAADTHMRTELCLEALRQATAVRGSTVGTIHHSDRGSQYASNAYQKALAVGGFMGSMSRKGDCWDNAVVESFFGTLKTELIHRRLWATPAEARSAIATYIHQFYNPVRFHSSNAYLSPNEKEHKFKLLFNQAA